MIWAIHHIEMFTEKYIKKINLKSCTGRGEHFIGNCLPLSPKCVVHHTVRNLYTDCKHSHPRLLAMLVMHSGVYNKLPSAFQRCQIQFYHSFSYFVYAKFKIQLNKPFACYAVHTTRLAWWSEAFQSFSFKIHNCVLMGVAQYAVLHQEKTLPNMVSMLRLVTKVQLATQIPNWFQISEVPSKFQETSSKASAIVYSVRLH